MKFLWCKSPLPFDPRWILTIVNSRFVLKNWLELFFPIQFRIINVKMVVELTKKMQYLFPVDFQEF